MSRRAEEQERLGKNGCFFSLLQYLHAIHVILKFHALLLCCLRGCTCSSSLSCSFWLGQWRAMRGAASRCIDSPSLFETWPWRTCRMERSAWAGPSEGLLPMERKVGWLLMAIIIDGSSYQCKLEELSDKTIIRCHFGRFLFLCLIFVD